MNFNTVETEFGIVIPACAKFEKVNETRSFMDEFEDERSYCKSRLTKLNVSLDVEYKAFNMDAKAGFNKNRNASGCSATSEYSFLFEQRMFELKVANFKEYQKNGITFTSDFESDVKDLPEKYDKNDPDNRSRFERFFNRFGHFIVSSAYGGGAIETKTTNQIWESKTLSFDEVKASLSVAFDGGFWKAEGEVSGSDSLSTSASSKALLNQSTLHWLGGDRNLHNRDTVTHREKMLKWQTSLLVNPTMLTTEMSLEPISTAIACVAPEKDQASYNALKDVLGGEFKVLANRKEEKEEDNRRKAEEEERKTEEAITRAESVQKPDTSNKDGCFPSTSFVYFKGMNGNIKQKQITNLRAGDKVIAWDTKRQRCTTSEVIMFAHLDPDSSDVEYLKIILQDGSCITLTGNHLVITGEHLGTTMAINVSQGHILFTVDESGTLSPQKVVAVEKITDSGLFCPITREGNLFVNNVLVSCYASVKECVFLGGVFKISAQNIAHLGLMPMRALHNLRVKWVRKIPKNQHIHPYVKWLTSLKFPLMDSKVQIL